MINNYILTIRKIPKIYGCTENILTAAGYIHIYYMGIGNLDVLGNDIFSNSKLVAVYYRFVQHFAL